ncbi:MAG: hypothetical protein AVO35_07305 [Candidatus Aegiribacteria sp. MLS_C]|nr:MAG: hypothetical protein AVO35_07305 [Candidatus Aegiribacteria sp. MLS_C]
MKRYALTLGVLAVLAVGTLSTANAARTHIIRYGDTLWDLSIQYYSTPFNWEDIMRANPSLEGVEYLRPGEELIIPDIYGETVQLSQASEYPSGVYTTSGSSSRPMLSRLVLETTGMVTDTPPQPSGYVIDTDLEEEDPFDDIHSYPGDLLAIDIGQSDGVQQDMVFRLCKTGGPVYHPETGADLGEVIRVSGVCRVVDVDPNSSVALLEHAYLPVTYGDFLLPYDAAEPVPVATAQTVENLDAYVIAFRDPQSERAYSFDVLYIDRGSLQGLQPGDIYAMFRYGDQVLSPDSRTLQEPDVPVAEMIVLDTTDDTAAMLVFSISTSDLIRIGDRIELVREQL